MREQNDIAGNKRYTLATRAINLEDLIVTGIFIALMIIWACLIKDKRFLFIPLFFLSVCFIIFILLAFRYVKEPKIAIQADRKGIYLFYRNNKEIFIDYDNIVKIWSGPRNKYGAIYISTVEDEYKSINIKEDKGDLVSQITYLLELENKQNYLTSIEIKLK